MTTVLVNDDVFSLILFVVAGVFPIFTRFLSVVLIQTKAIRKIHKLFAPLSRIFLWFTSFSVFAQSPEPITHAFEWGYQLIYDGEIVEEKRIPFNHGLFTCLFLFKEFENHQCESYAEFIINEVIKSDKDFNEFALIMWTKERSKLPDGLFVKINNDEFAKKPFMPAVIFLCEV